MTRSSQIALPRGPGVVAAELAQARQAEQGPAPPPYRPTVVEGVARASQQEAVGTARRGAAGWLARLGTGPWLRTNCLGPKPFLAMPPAGPLPSSRPSGRSAAAAKSQPPAGPHSERGGALGPLGAEANDPLNDPGAQPSQRRKNTNNPAAPARLRKKIRFRSSVCPL